jgi:prepilin-type N-terminal cleavage/methylation domain-containing protein
MQAGRSNRGFTLIELLVVIAIIAILAALLFPIFQKAHEQARKSGCRSNIRQIVTAIRMYCDDHDGFMCPYSSDGAPGVPNGLGHEFGYGMYLLRNYYKDKAIWACPSGHRYSAGFDRSYDSPGYKFVEAQMTYKDPRTAEVYYTNYELGFDDGAGRGHTLGGHNLYEDYKDSTKVQVIMDYPCNYGANASQGELDYWLRTVVKEGRRSHKDGCVVGCLDGHTEWWDHEWRYNHFVGYGG